jgi:hypothetical protein
MIAYFAEVFLPKLEVTADIAETLNFSSQQKHTNNDLLLLIGPNTRAYNLAILTNIEMCEREFINASG